MIGAKIKRQREQLGMTQEDLAEKIGVAVLQINRYENEKSEPKADMIKKIAEALHTSADYLLGLTDDPLSYELKTVELTPKERMAITAWRKHHRFEAIKVIVDDD